MKDIGDPSSKNLGIFYPLLYVCLTISGPTLGILLSNPDPSLWVAYAFFIPLLTFLGCYVYVLLRKPHLLLSVSQRNQIELLIAETKAVTKGQAVGKLIDNEEVVSKPPKENK